MSKASEHHLSATRHNEQAAHHCSEAARQHAEHCDTKAKPAPAAAPKVA
jgi:hypothetical protein